jgi:NADPH:quinone reductase-like Zn-dependent oxidoreductase
MKAAVLERHGAPFRLVDVPRPVPDAGEVLVKVFASGVNPLDTKIHAGAAAHARHPLPAILGLDLAGVVEELGPSVASLHRGDEVYGMTGGVGGVPGSLAEFAVADAALLAKKPANLSMHEAAALPLIVITAWEGLVDRANVRAGQSVLIQGAGGVGHIAIQLARVFGAKVFATYRADRAALVRSLGATPIEARRAVDDYVAEHTGGVGFDLVYDTIGGAALDASFAAVRRFGHVVSCLGWGTHALAPLSLKGASYSGVFTLLPLLTGEGRAHHGAILAEAARLVERGQLVPHLDPRRFGLDSVADAHAALVDRTANGKLVVTIQ